MRAEEAALDEAARLVLVRQQSVADPSRSRGDLQPIRSYAHLPASFGRDATAVIEAQIERFARGCRDQIQARHVRSTTQLTTEKPNDVSCDVITGANTAGQLIVRPALALDPYSTGIDGTDLCSAANLPGPEPPTGCAAQAALTALRRLNQGFR